MTSFFVLIILFFTFCQSINSQSTTTSIFNSTENTTVINFTGLGNETNQTQISVTTIGITTTTNSSNITINSTEMASTTTTLQSNISTTPISPVESTISDIDSKPPSNGKHRSSWWLLIALLVTAVVVVSIGVIYYNRRHNPYRRCSQCWKQFKFRFLQNWRSRDDEADNIILQLEQPEITNGQWPPRISFA